jgi:hypothetical protein
MPFEGRILWASESSVRFLISYSRNYPRYKLLGLAVFAAIVGAAFVPHDILHRAPASTPLPQFTQFVEARAASATCSPDQPCWPSLADWDRLNATVFGALFALLSPTALSAAPGHSCELSLASTAKPASDVHRPAALRSSVIEPCKPVTHPPALYAVTARSDAAVSAALAFASKHSLRVVVKYGGDERALQGGVRDAVISAQAAAGVASGVTPLVLWVTGPKSARVHGFPHPAPVCPSRALLPPAAVSAGPGDTWDDVSAAVRAFNHELRVAEGAGPVQQVVLDDGQRDDPWNGHAESEPVCGAYHSSSSVLLYRAILANGSAVNVTECSHPELFWALNQESGRGGAPLAVITSVSLALRPSAVDSGVEPVVAGSGHSLSQTALSFRVALLQGTESAAQALDYVLSMLGGTGPVVASTGSVLLHAQAGRHVLQGVLCVNGTIAETTATLGASLLTWAQTHPTDVAIEPLALAAAEQPSLGCQHRPLGTTALDQRASVAVGSWLLPSGVLSGDARERAAFVRNLTLGE